MPENDNLQTTETADVPVENTPGTEPILVWEAKEYAEYSRSRRWYLAVGVTGVLLSLGALIIAIVFTKGLRDQLGQGLVAAVFAMATVVVLRHADDEPRQLVYSISKLGVTVGDVFYPYNELKQYWIIYKPPVKALHLQTTNKFKPIIRIDLADLDPLAVREALKNYLPEDTKHEEDFLDRFSRMIRL